jgi:hypothetical protein
MQRGLRLPFAAPGWLPPGLVSGGIVGLGILAWNASWLLSEAPHAAGRWNLVLQLCLWALLPLPLIAGAARGVFRGGFLLAWLVGWFLLFKLLALASDSSADWLPLGAFLQRLPSEPSSLGWVALSLGIAGYLGLMISAGVAQDEPSLDSLSPALGFAAPWLVATGASGGGLWGVFAAGAGLLLLGLAVWRSQGRARFLKRVLAGQDTSWRYQAESSSGARNGLVAFDTQHANAGGVLSYRVSSSGGAAYRTAEAWVPVARLAEPRAALSLAALRVRRLCLWGLLSLAGWAILAWW